MNIALIGYGKMGKVIEEIAISRGHNIVARCTSQSPIEDLDFRIIDIAIEFTAPHMAVKHIDHCMKNHTPVVVGTTAWNEQLPEVRKMVTKNDGALLYASNFSIGVNIFFDINKRLSELMAPHSEYVASIDEIHHLQKLDAPSGTAITLANDMMFSNDNLVAWVHNEDVPPNIIEGQIAVTSHRKDGVPGTHIIRYNSEIDSIEIKHTAHSRSGFALGSIVAAEWLIGKQGVFTMQDVIK